MSFTPLPFKVNLVCAAAVLWFSGAALAQPVATPPANVASQKPAFEGQTRAPEVKTEVAFTKTVIRDGFQHPWGVTFLPDGRLLVSERPGRLNLVSADGKSAQSIAGVPEVVARGQGGLLDVSVSPDFTEDRWVYFSFSEPRDEGKNGTSVGRGKLSQDGTQLEQVEIIFQQMPAWSSHHHYGSRLVWSDDKHLFVTLGDRGSAEFRGKAQDPNTHIGKTLRLNADGTAAKGNPYAEGGGQPEVWSYGHRNVQSAAIDAKGQFWTLEHGPQGGDELNRPQPGKNYGWPVITYGQDYSGAAIGEGITQMAGMEQPLYYFDPVIAPGGMTFYSGKMFPQWQGDLLVSSLTPGALVRLRLEQDKVVAEERLLVGVGRVRDVAEGPDGALWLITDSDNGELIKLTKK